MNATSTLKTPTISSNNPAGSYAPPTVRALRVDSAAATEPTSALESARLALATAEAERFFVLEKLLATK